MSLAKDEGRAVTNDEGRQDEGRQDEGRRTKDEDEREAAAVVGPNFSSANKKPAEFGAARAGGAS
jgi:hypothetical protein